MLTDEERNKIEEKLIYRLAVKKKLKGDQKKLDVLSKTLDSPFFLWFMSSVVLAIFTWGYTWYANYLSAKHEKAAQVQKLNAEIGYRIFQAVGEMNDTTKQLNAGTTSEPMQIYNNACYYLNNEQPSKQNFALYQEFKNDRFESLLAQLFVLSDDDADKQQISKAMLQYEKFSSNASIGVPATGQNATNSVLDNDRAAVAEIETLIQSEMGKSEWKNGLFAY